MLTFRNVHHYMEFDPSYLEVRALVYFPSSVIKLNQPFDCIHVTRTKKDVGASGALLEESYCWIKHRFALALEQKLISYVIATENRPGTK